MYISCISRGNVWSFYYIKNSLSRSTISICRKCTAWSICPDADITTFKYTSIISSCINCFSINSNIFIRSTCGFKPSTSIISICSSYYTFYCLNIIINSFSMCVNVWNFTFTSINIKFWCWSLCPDADITICTTTWNC